MDCPWKTSAKNWRNQALYFQWMFRISFGTIFLAAFLTMLASMVKP